MKDKNQKMQILTKLVDHIKAANCEGQLLYRGEISNMVRCGCSVISLNTTEVVERLFITIQREKRRIEQEVTFALGYDAIEEIIDQMIAKVDAIPAISWLKEFSQIPEIKQGISVYDQATAEIDSKKMCNFFAAVIEEFSDRETEVSGAFAAGGINYALVNTAGEKLSAASCSDFNAEVVVQMTGDSNKEIRSAQCGDNIASLSIEQSLAELNYHWQLKTSTTREDLAPGKYDVIFGGLAIADMLGTMGWIGFSGEGHLYKNSMFTQAELEEGSQVFSEKVTISDDWSDERTLHRRQLGYNGINCPKMKLIDRGHLSNLFYTSDIDCGRFGKECNSDAQRASLLMEGGEGVNSLTDVMQGEYSRPTIYISFAHYMNVTNPVKGEITFSSRFGTYLLGENGFKTHLYNLRIADSLRNLFNNIEWMSEELMTVDVSSSYGIRNPKTITVPKMVLIKDVNIIDSSK